MADPDAVVVSPCPNRTSGYFALLPGATAKGGVKDVAVDAYGIAMETGSHLPH